MNLFEGKTLISTKDLADNKILSLSKQAEERAAGRLRHVRIGRKVAYLPTHIESYLALCEQGRKEPSGAAV